ncbi:MAG: hypothetical protein ABI670_04090 [Chloroflexota bacterium]
MGNRYARHSPHSWWSIALLLPLLMGLAGMHTGNAAPQSQAQAVPRLVLAFYYMWYSPADFDIGQMLDRPVAPYNSSRKRWTGRCARHMMPV